MPIRRQTGLSVYAIAHAETSAAATTWFGLLTRPAPRQAPQPQAHEARLHAARQSALLETQSRRFPHGPPLTCRSGHGRKREGTLDDRAVNLLLRHAHSMQHGPIRRRRALAMIGSPDLAPIVRRHRCHLRQDRLFQHPPTRHGGRLLELDQSVRHRRTAMPVEQSQQQVIILQPDECRAPTANLPYLRRVASSPWGAQSHRESPWRDAARHRPPAAIPPDPSRQRR